jgi:uncharacterized membrane protein SirB2
MIEFYPQIKLVHVSAVMLSGSLFALRGLSLLAGLRWPRHALVRYLSYSIDTVLLTAAMMLLTILPRELYANGWLLAKLGFVASYVVLGILGFRPQRGRGARAGLLLAAALCFLQAYCTARAHHPLGAFYLLGG